MSFWAITSYFNPTNSRRRLENFREFRRALSLPLIVVEWCWNKGPGPALSSRDADIVIQVSGGDLLWQKERLLNIAVKGLPADCQFVAWLDCDVVFDDPEWYRQTERLLQKVPIVQPYGTLINLDSRGNPRPLGVQGGGPKGAIANPETRASLPEDTLEHEFKHVAVACGYAWTARASLLKKHGLYDACIVGSGDRAIFCAAAGLSEKASRYLRMNRARYDHFLRWARPFGKDVSGQIGWTDCTMRNLWHGAPINRRYEQRHVEFERFNFDPLNDISIGPTGVWQWSSHKPDMHQYLIEYFFSRREDEW